MKKSISYADELRNEMYDIAAMLKKEGKSGAECRYIEIMAALLALILDGQKIIRTLLSIFAGSFLGMLVSALLRG